MYWIDPAIESCVDVMSVSWSFSGVTKSARTFTSTLTPGTHVIRTPVSVFAIKFEVHWSTFAS